MCCCSFLREVSQSEPQVFMCHFYNTYFAHTAGGRMIGSKVSQMILDNKQLNFYKYDSDVKELLGNVRDSINEVCPSFYNCACLAKTYHHADHAGMLAQHATHLQPAMLCLLWSC